MKGFLSFIPGNSFFHNLNPVTKLFYSMAICAGCFMSDKWQVLLFLLAVGILSGMVSGICQRTFSLLKGLFKVSIFLVTLQILLIRTGNTIWTIPLVNLAITDNGINTSAVLVLKLSGATLPLALMLSVTKLQVLSNALVDKLRIPYKYAFTLTTAIKFIPVFAEEMAGIIEAQTSRGITLDTKNPFKKVALILPLCAPLLVSSVRKTSATAIAADLRGFKLRTRNSIIKKQGTKFIDVVCVVFSLLLIAISLEAKFALVGITIPGL